MVPERGKGCAGHVPAKSPFLHVQTCSFLARILLFELYLNLVLEHTLLLQVKATELN